MLNMQNDTFGLAFVSLFAQITGILQMAEFLGPTFTPFAPEILSPFRDTSTWAVGKRTGIYAKQQEEQEETKMLERSVKKKRKRKKKDNTSSTTTTTPTSTTEKDKDL